jgi:hypothetical protein
MVPQPGGGFKGTGTPIKKTATAKGDKNAAAYEIKVGKKGLKNGVRIGVDLESVEIKCPCTNQSECDAFKDASVAKAYADAVIERDRVLKDLEDDLERANEELAEAEAELQEAETKRKYEEALAALEAAADALQAAEDAREAFEDAEKAFKAASDAHKNAKGKDAKAAALKAKNAAKDALDDAKAANPSESTLRSLRVKAKAAEEAVDKMEKDLKAAMRKISEINQKIADAYGKVLVILFGLPSMKDGAGKEIEMGDKTEFFAVKGNAKMEFTLTVSFYCTSAECAPTDCARTFIIKIEE